MNWHCVRTVIWDHMKTFVTEILPATVMVLGAAAALIGLLFLGFTFLGEAFMFGAYITFIGGVILFWIWVIGTEVWNSLKEDYETCVDECEQEERTG